MVVVIPPRIAVTDAIQFIKTQSAKKLKAKFPFILNKNLENELTMLAGKEKFIKTNRYDNNFSRRL